MIYPEMNASFRGAHFDITVFRAHRLPGCETDLIFDLTSSKRFARHYALSDADVRTLAHLLLRSIGDEPMPDGAE